MANFYSFHFQFVSKNQSQNNKKSIYTLFCFSISAFFPSILFIFLCSHFTIKLIRQSALLNTSTIIYICLMLWYQSVPDWFAKLFPGLTWSLPGHSGKDVYLTFDDGPHPEISKWVLDTLDQFQMKATFFLVGDNVNKYPETYNLILSKGHRCGNHTMHHLKGWNTATESYIHDVEACRLHVDSDLFRPPYGRMTKGQRKYLSTRYKIIMWSLLSCDFNKKLNSEKALKGLIKKTINGSVVVFHDSVKAEKNLKYILPRYLEFLKSEGFICKTL